VKGRRRGCEREEEWAMTGARRACEAGAVKASMP
jgi:hypothetical protein